MAKDLLARLADAGEDAITKLGESSRLDRITGLVNSTRERLDELTRRVRGLEALEQRVEELEKRVGELSQPAKSKPSPAAKTTAKKPKPKPEAATESEAAAGSEAKTGGDSPG